MPLFLDHHKNFVKRPQTKLPIHILLNVADSVLQVEDCHTSSVETTRLGDKYPGRFDSRSMKLCSHSGIVHGAYNLGKKKRRICFLSFFAPYFCSNVTNYVPPRKLLRRRYICDQYQVSSSIRLFSHKDDLLQSFESTAQLIMLTLTAPI